MTAQADNFNGAGPLIPQCVIIAGPEIFILNPIIEMLASKLTPSNHANGDFTALKLNGEGSGEMILMPKVSIHRYELNCECHPVAMITFLAKYD